MPWLLLVGVGVAAYLWGRRSRGAPVGEAVSDAGADLIGVFGSGQTASGGRLLVSPFEIQHEGETNGRHLDLEAK